jgi:hypothetical protein
MITAAIIAIAKDSKKDPPALEIQKKKIKPMVILIIAMIKTDNTTAVIISACFMLLFFP